MKDTLAGLVSIVFKAGMGPHISYAWWTPCTTLWQYPKLLFNLLVLSGLRYWLRVKSTDYPSLVHAHALAAQDILSQVLVVRNMLLSLPTLLCNVASGLVELISQICGLLLTALSGAIPLLTWGSCQ